MNPRFLKIGHHLLRVVKTVGGECIIVSPVNIKPACVEMQDIAGSWEVQFGYDAERTYPVEIVATSDPDSPDQLDLFSFEFLVETGCLWSGEIEVHGL